MAAGSYPCVGIAAGQKRKGSVLANVVRKFTRVALTVGAREVRQAMKVLAIKALSPFAIIFAVAHSAQAADVEAGERLASTVCAACHGASGISVSDTVPNLAGQRAR
jgi:cytochrome c553